MKQWIIKTLKKILWIHSPSRYYDESMEDDKNDLS